MGPKQQTRTKGLRVGMLLSSQESAPSPRKAWVTASPKHKHDKSPAPRKPKKTVNINAMFEHSASKHPHVPTKLRSVLSPVKAGVQKSSTKKPGFFTALHEQRQNLPTALPYSIRDPEFFTDLRARQSRRSLGITKAIEPYLNDIHESWQEKLQAQHKSLEAVRQGIDPKTGKKRPGLPTQEDFAKLMQEIEDLDRSVEDEIVQLAFQNGDRSPLVKRIRLGDIRDSCIQRMQRKRARIDELREQQRSIEVEVAKIRSVIDGGDEASKKANKEHEAQLAAFEKAMDQADAQAKAERVKMKKEESNTTKEINRKLNELFEIMD